MTACTDKEPTAFQGRKDTDNYARGLYSDGVYVGPPVHSHTGPVTPLPSKATEEAQKCQDNLTSSTQEAYYNLLRHRFLLLRSTLRCAPPASAIAALDDSHPITLPRGSRSARKEWRQLLLSVDPQMVQLACMDMDTVLSVLGIMARLMSENVRSGDAEKVRRISAWAWGLLGKCREVGQLGTEEVGEIRDLGKRAVKILLKMKEDEDERSKIDSTALDKEEEASVSSSDDQEGPLDVRDGDSADDENDNIPEPSNNINANNAAHASDFDSDMPDAEPEPEPELIPPSEELDAAKVRLQAQLRFSHGPEQEQQQIETDVPEDKGSQNLDLEAERAAHAADVVKQTHAMLDMIITVVGEYYGQRDLLAAREIWKVSL